jgi:hypothetical protein
LRISKHERVRQMRLVRSEPGLSRESTWSLICFRRAGESTVSPSPVLHSTACGSSPGQRRLAGNSARRQTDTQETPIAQVAVSKPPCWTPREAIKGRKPVCVGFLDSEGGYLLRGEEYCGYILGPSFRPVNPWQYVVSAAHLRILAFVGPVTDCCHVAHQHWWR